MSTIKVTFANTGYLPNKNALSVIKNQRKSAYYSTYSDIFIEVVKG